MIKLIPLHSPQKTLIFPEKVPVLLWGLSIALVYNLSFSKDCSEKKKGGGAADEF